MKTSRTSTVGGVLGLALVLIALLTISVSVTRAWDWRPSYLSPCAAPGPEPVAWCRPSVAEIEYEPAFPRPWLRPAQPFVVAAAYFPVPKPSYAPLSAMVRWVRCVNAYNAAPRRAESIGGWPGPAPTARVPDPFGPCGPLPTHEPGILLPHESAGPPRPLSIQNGGALR